jgi:hypothetical protein
MLLSSQPSTGHQVCRQGEGAPDPMPRRVLIMGAAGRDFHNFNVMYRDSADHEVVAFTATQIPFIEDRLFPAELAGPRYPDGIQIHPEKDLDRLIRELAVDEVAFSYSDVSHTYVMGKASQVMAAGAGKHKRGPGTPCSRRGFRWWRCALCAPGAARARPRAGSARRSARPA